jgi:hypothetical protein
MKIATGIRLCSLIAFLALNVPAATCISGISLASLSQLGSSGCTFGGVTFSDFYSNFTSTTGTTTPNASTDVTVDFQEISDNSSSDTFGTVGTSSNPIFIVTVNFNGGENVSEFQNLQYALQYLVSDNTAGTQLVQVDAAIFGSITPSSSGATASLTRKALCAAGTFNQTAGAPTGVCSQGSSQTYTAVSSAGLPLTDNINGFNADSSINYAGLNNGHFAGPGTPGSSTLGVYDQINLNGGATSASANAQVDAVENAFVLGATPATPEPAGFLLLACALAAFGATRRHGESA